MLGRFSAVLSSSTVTRNRLSSLRARLRHRTTRHSPLALVKVHGHFTRGQNNETVAGYGWRASVDVDYLALIDVWINEEVACLGDVFCNAVKSTIIMSKVHFI